MLLLCLTLRYEVLAYVFVKSLIPGLKGVSLRSLHVGRSESSVDALHSGYALSVHVAIHASQGATRFGTDMLSKFFYERCCTGNT